MDAQYADCQLQILRDQGDHRVIGYAIQSPGFRQTLEKFVGELKADGVESRIEKVPFPHVVIPFVNGIWETVAAVFHRVAMSEADDA